MKRPGPQVPSFALRKVLSLGPAGVWEAVDRSEIGLDVDERRAIDAVDLAHDERGCLDPDQLNGSERDRIGPHRRAQGKRPAGVVQVRGHLLYEIAPYSVHPIEQQNVAVEREVSKPRRIARIKL